MLPASPTLVTSGNLQDRAMSVHLRLSCWRARVTDKTITRETNATRGIASDMGNYTKRLVAPQALDKIVKLQGQWRNWHLSQTLPWGDDNTRLLPTPFFTGYVATSRDYAARHDPLVEEFCQEYPQHYATARVLLGAAFNPADYPPAYDIPSRFAARYVISDFPDPSDYRLPSSLSTADADAIRAAAITDVSSALRDANIAILKRLLEPVQHMARKLREYDATADAAYTGPQVRFHDSLVENVESIIALIPAFNITNDPIVNDFAKQCVTLLAHSPDELRDSTLARNATADEADRITRAMAQFF